MKNVVTLTFFSVCICTGQENIDIVHKLVMKNRRITLQGVEETTDISYGSINGILHDKLNMCKVCARWVPRDDMKLSRVTNQ